MPYPDGMRFNAIEEWWGKDPEWSMEDAIEIGRYETKMKELAALLEFFKDDLSVLELDEDIWDVLNDSLEAMKESALARAEEALLPDPDRQREDRLDREEFFYGWPDVETYER